MTLVQFFENDNISNLQKNVNKFLNELRGFEEVIDVKYNHYFDQDMDSVWYTAMVIYRNPVPEESDIFKDSELRLTDIQKDKDPI